MITPYDILRGISSVQKNLPGINKKAKNFLAAPKDTMKQSMPTVKSFLQNTQKANKVEPVQAEKTSFLTKSEPIKAEKPVDNFNFKEGIQRVKNAYYTGELNPVKTASEILEHSAGPFVAVGSGLKGAATGKVASTPKPESDEEFHKRTSENDYNKVFKTREEAQAALDRILAKDAQLIPSESLGAKQRAQAAFASMALAFFNPDEHRSSEDPVKQMAWETAATLGVGILRKLGAQTVKTALPKITEVVKYKNITISPEEVTNVAKKVRGLDPVLSPRESQVAEYLKTVKDVGAAVKGKAPVKIKVERKAIDSLRDKWKSFIGTDMPKPVTAMIESAHPKDLVVLSKKFDDLLELKNKFGGEKLAYLKTPGKNIPENLPQKTGRALSKAEQDALDELKANLAAEKLTAKEAMPKVKKPIQLVDDSSQIQAGISPVKTVGRLSPEVMAEYQRLQEAYPTDKSVAIEYLKKEQEKIKSAHSEKPISISETPNLNKLPTVTELKSISETLPKVKQTTPKNFETRLSGELSGAKPRYSYGSKQFQLNFSNDVDKAAYITAQPSKSGADSSYLKFVMDKTGMSEPEVRVYGMKVKNFIKGLAQNADPNRTPVLNVQYIQAPIGENAITTKPTLIKESTVEIPQNTQKASTVAEIAERMQASGVKPKKAKRVAKSIESEGGEIEAAQTEIKKSEPNALKSKIKEDIQGITEMVNEFETKAETADAGRLNQMNTMVEEAINNPQQWVDYARANPKWWQRIVQDAKNSGGVTEYLINLGHEYLPYIKNKDYLKTKTDFIRNSKRDIEEPVRMFVKLFPDNVDPESLKIGLFDVWWRTMLRRLNEGKDIPFGLNKAEVTELINKNNIALKADKKAQAVVRQYDKNRLKMLDDMEESGFTVSDEMKSNPDYFPIRIVDDFVDRISNSTTYRQKTNPSFTKTQTGSQRAANLNLPQVVLEMYHEAYKSMPLKSFIKDVMDRFILKDIDGKPMRPTSKASVPEGYVAYQFNPLQFFKTEGLTEKGLEKMMEDQSMDFGEYANQIMSSGKAPWFIMPKEVAEDVARMSQAQGKSNQLFKKATGVFKKTSIMAKITAYMLRNLFSDVMAASMFSNNTARFIKYYAEAWADLSAYYITGKETPLVKELKSVGGLQAGFVSESFKNPILDAPEMSRSRKLLFGETSKLDHLALFVKRLMSVQEVAGRLALAKDLGDGKVTMNSFKEANKLMVDYDGASNAKRALEAGAPFNMWLIGMNQSLLSSMLGKTTFMDMSNSYKLKRALKVMGILGAYALWRYKLNHRDEDGQIAEETALQAMNVPTTEWTADQVTDSIEYAKEIGVKPSRQFLPSNSSYTVIAGNDGKPLINERGEVLLMMLDSPSSAMNLPFDFARALEHGYGSQFIAQKINPVAVGAFEALANTNIQTGQPITKPGTPALKDLGERLTYYISKNIGPVRVLANLKRDLSEGRIKTVDDFQRSAARQFLPVYSVDLNKLKKNINTARFTKGEPEAKYAEDQKRKEIYDPAKVNFINPVKNLFLNRLDQKGLITTRYNSERTPYVKGISEGKAKQAFAWLRSQPLENQVKAMQFLFGDMKSPEETAFYQDGSKVRFNTIYGNLISAIKRGDESPTALNMAKADMADYISRLTPKTIENLTWDDQTVRANLVNARQYLKDKGIPPEMIKEVEKNQVIGKLLDLTGESPAEIYKAIGDLEQFLFGESEKSPNPLPKVELAKNVPLGSSLGGGKASGGIKVAYAKGKAPKARKNVEFEATSLLPSKGGYKEPNIKLEPVKFTPTPLNMIQMPPVRFMK